MMLNSGLLLFTQITPGITLENQTKLNCSGPVWFINNFYCYINNPCFEAWLKKTEAEGEFPALLSLSDSSELLVRVTRRELAVCFIKGN